ncbi:MAG: HAMP domain-containing sensor histidine kinase [Lachnospiraceae bacterium]
MKLWQKIFIYTLILVMLAVGMTSILLLENSYSLAMNQKKQSVYNEHEFLVTSFKSMLLTERLQQNAIVLEKYIVKQFMAQTFEKGSNGSGVIFYNDKEEEIYTNITTQIPKELLKKAEEEPENYMQLKNGYLYMISKENIEGQSYYVATEHNVSSVIEIHESMLKRIQVISMGCAVGIALILLFVVKMLLLPLQQINQGTYAIAHGKYEKRIPEKGHDELSELAYNMNKMAEAVEKNIKALENVAENRKQFIDNLSHEMKTPLTSILGFSDLLQIKKDISDDKRIEYAGIIKEEARRMRTLSGKLMELITVGEVNIEWKLENMEKLLDEIGNSLKVIADSCHMKLICKSQAGTLLVDKELIKSLLYNVVDNAIKASKEGDSIEVTGYFEEDEYVVKIQDEGVGIPTEEVDKIIQAFYMVDKVRSRASGGAGLGLALCSEIVSLHHGIMSFESELGKGTCVTLRLKGGASGEEI